MRKLFLLLLLATTSWPLLAQNVVQLEYFFNADAGYGRNRVISATPSGSGEINFVPDLTGLSVGSHMLYTRVRDNNGQWSQTTRRTVEIYSINPIAQVSQVEYAIDVDLGFGKNTIVNTTPGTNVSPAFTVSVAGIAEGRHILYTRVKDNTGRWSQTMRHSMEVYSVSPATTVVAVEYFFDVDPGYAKATRQEFTVPSTDGEFVLTIPQDQVPEGTHNLYVRVIGSNPRFSHTQFVTKNFQVNNCGIPAQPAVIANSSSCSGATATYTVPAVAGADSYQWDVPAGVQITSGQGTNSITVQLPTVAASTNYTISVAAANSCGTGTPRSFSVTVNPSPVPTIQITASSTTACAGSLITFTATATNAGTPVYRWKRNGAEVGTNSNTYSSNALANGDQITCEVTSSLACASPATVTSNTIQLNIQAAVAPSISIIASSTTICPGTNVTFTATATNAGANPAYQWRVNGANVGTNSSTFSSTTLQNGDQVTCVVTSTLACASPTTATSNTVAISVSASVAPTISISASSTTICAGTNVTFTATATNAGANPGYQWRVNGANMGTNSPTFSSATLQNGDQVTCVVTSALACASPTTATSNTVGISVSASVAPTINISASSTTICAGTNVTFTAITTNAGANPAYQWRVNGANVGTNSSTFSSTTLQNGDQVTCVVTSTLACASPTTATSNTVAISVSASVAPTISISASSTTICAGTNVTFTAIATNAGANPGYQWLVNGANVGTNSPTYSSTTLQNGDQVTCVVTSASACASPTTATSNTVAISVSASVAPTINISASSTTICAGTNVTFTATATNAGATPTYQWKRNGVNVGANSNTYSSNALANGDEVTCVVTSSLSCASPNAVTSNAVRMNVSASATASITIAASSSNICAGTLVTFTASTTNAGPNPTYQWKVNGNNVGSNISTYTHNNPQDGDQVSCVLTSTASCVSNATVNSNAITIRVSEGTAGSIAITGTTTVASGGLVILSSNVNGVTGPYAIQWQDSTATHGWQDIASASNPTLNYAPAKNGDRVRCILTSTSSCGVVVNSYSNELVFNVVSSGNPSGGNIRCYPNPTNGIITVDSLNLDDEWSRLDVLDARGDMALKPRGINGQTSVELDLHHLPGGFYLIRLWTRSGSRAVLKIIKY